MYRKICLLILLCSLCLTACGPSEEKIAQAQEKYAQLAQIHNQAVEAHGEVSDSSLDEALVELKDRAAELGVFNLAEMDNEEIEQLIQTMDELIGSYSDCISRLADIKRQEEEAVLTPILLTLSNHTDFSFSGLSLYERGDRENHVNVLENLEPLVPEQSLTGLTVQRDVDNTPWILVLADSEGKEYELELPVKEYDEEVTLNLVYDAEEGSLKADDQPREQDDTDVEEGTGA